MGLEDRDYYREDFKRRQSLADRPARSRTTNQPWHSDYPRPGARRLPWFLFGFVCGAVVVIGFLRFA